ncbi:MAG: hypothetical protein JXB48_01855 [Candidatus Latescibacteria bacterium]|nr:hypothetical protein [Candidatus Latescibacterota bacterium]
MVDNFDTNVARRKPNTTKTKPKHPWDVPKSSAEDDLSDITVDDSIQPDSVPQPLDNDLTVHEKNSESSEPVGEKKITFVPLADDTFSVHKNDSHTRDQKINKKHSDLSDTINIHSNFCKLDNDVSDHLFAKLSPSAQSVYLRLYRQSFGWNRNWAAESLPKLKNSCNLSLQTVRKSIKELEIKGCISKEFSDYHKATVYRVYLPSEIGVSNNAPLIIDTQKRRGQHAVLSNTDSKYSQSQIPDTPNETVQYSDMETLAAGEVKNLEAHTIITGGQNSVIQSVYFSGTSIYNLLESGGALPKNILKYINNTYLIHAVDAIDEFYDSIGFSVVSRALYRKSLIDYFDIIKSGFSPDDIKYAVRWTFKNSRTRPESFSLIKHTMHLAMSDLIDELKNVSGEKDNVKEKQAALRNKKKLEEKENIKSLTNEELKTWFDVLEELKTSLNEHSYAAFIEPLKLVSVDNATIVLNSPPDSVSWTKDHFLDLIQEVYCKHANNDVLVVII